MTQLLWSRIHVVALVLVIACSSPGVSPEEGVDALVLPLTAADCPAGYTIISGTSGADNLVGTAGDDCILGLGGNDTIHGGGGNDVLIGGNGDDTLYGDGGNDTLYGEAGADRLEGGDGDDSAYGGTGVDTIYGGAGNDKLDGQDNGDFIYGEDGNDTLLGSAAADTIDGGPGRDVIDGGDGDDIIHGGLDDDDIHGSANVDTIYGDEGDDVIDGGLAADKLWGGPGDDVIYGNDGNDQINGEAGDDALIGGAGSNTVDGGAGTDACSGSNCEKPQPTLSGCTQDSQCGPFTHCVSDFGLCLGCVADSDNDHVCDSHDGCPADPAKAAPGACGCGVADTDADGDGVPNCNDACPNDPQKTVPGACGCGVADADNDHDGVLNCQDVCAAGDDHADQDADGLADACDPCPRDAANDADGDGICGDVDRCPTGDDHLDSDGDGIPNACDPCPSDITNDSDGDGICDSVDTCPGGNDSADADHDGVCDHLDLCASANDRQDDDGDGVVDHCEILRPTSVVGAGVYFYKAIDINADQKPDLLGSTFDFTNQGAFEFQATHAPGRCQGLPLGDVDGDGHYESVGIDAVSDNAGYHQGYWLCYSDATGALAPHTLLNPSISAIAFAGDVTGDGVTDVIVSDDTKIQVFQLAAPPARGVVNVQTLPANRSNFAVSQVNALDLDGDGASELVVRVWDGELRVYRHVGSGPLQLDLLASTQGIGMDIGDVDGDGRLDLVTVAREGIEGNGGLALYRGLDPSQPPASDSFGNARYRFAAPIMFAKPYSMGYAVQGMGVADLAGSSAAEILLQTELGLYVMSYDRTTGYRVLQRVSSVGDVSFTGLVADFNADGKLDVVQRLAEAGRVLANVACRTGQGPDADGDGIPDACDACIGLNADADGDAVCDAADRCALGDDHLDTDLDGTPDACDSCPTDLHNDSDGDGSCDSQDPCPAGDDALDTDGDGVCDAMDLCPSTDDNLDANYDGMPDDCAPLTAAPVTTALPGASGYAAGDLDGDGLADLVSVADSELTTFHGLGDGNFEVIETQGGFNAYAIPPALVDLDQDGHLDAVVALGGGAYATLAYGDGTGHLELGQTLGSANNGLLVGDLNGDGRADVALVDNAGLKVWLGSAQRNGFAQALASDGLVKATIGDFDGDGVRELIGLRDNGYFFHLARRPDGSLFGEDFVTSSQREYYLQPQLVAAADVDRDGRDELLVSYVSGDSSQPPAVRIYGAVQATRLSGYDTSSGYGILDGYALTLQIRTELWVQAQVWSMQALDVVGDARSELLLPGSSGMSVYSWSSGPYQYLRKYQTTPIYWPGVIIALDLEGDGRKELLQPAWGSTSVWRGPTRP